MNKLNRHGFLKLASSGSAAFAAAPALSAERWLTATRTTGKALTLRAVVGLPTYPLPVYASYVIEGYVHLGTRSGALTAAVYAGPPEEMSTVALPGLSRRIRVTDVQDVAGVLHIRGEVDDRSQLHRGESHTVTIRIDRAHAVAWAGFGGSEVTLQLEED
jgi:hypothetical protein